MKAREHLLIGEVFIDFTVATNTSPCKMRLGGVVHAARGLWACGIPYSVAAICPSYILEELEDFLQKHGCIQFIHLGTVTGSPNVVVIGDMREISDQGYEDILRDVKKVSIASDIKLSDEFSAATIFPGRYDVENVIDIINQATPICIDIAYNINEAGLDVLLGRNIITIAISTSSDLFQKTSRNNVDYLTRKTQELGASFFLLKENRGGSRLFDLKHDQVHHIPSVLGLTANSIGVGDVYTAVFSALTQGGAETAAWRGMQAATSYAQTTYPDDFRAGVLRDMALPIDVVKSLGGVTLPWHERENYKIYLAAPDFSYIDKPEIDRSVSALQYHNIQLCRPIQENGEAPQSADASKLYQYYCKDIELLEQCVAVFAIPLNRDPGTLIEMGWAIANQKPVITFDPRRENNNTMVMCGSMTYSDDLDICLNAIFECISKIRVS